MLIKLSPGRGDGLDLRMMGPPCREPGGRSVLELELLELNEGWSRQWDTRGRHWITPGFEA